MTNDAFIPPARPVIGDEERVAVDRVMRSGMIAQGPEVAAFEEEFSQHFVQGLPTVAVNSGTSGLHLGLLAAGIGPGDEVIVPSFTFAATGNSVALTGATPVFADIEPATFSLDPASVEASITPRTKAIMPVHLYGHPAKMAELGAIAEKHGLMIFEDAAQAHGASLDGRPVGTFGRFAMFSLYPTKNMTSGEGGMVTTDTTELARQVRLLRNQGMERQYENEVVGFNARMTDIHAAIGRVQLTKVDAWTELRRSNAAYLDANLEGVVVPPVAEGAVHVYHQYTIRVTEDRDGFVAALKNEHQVGSGVYYPIPNHRLPSLAPYAPGLELPETETAVREVVSLPVHPSLSDRDLERIVERREHRRRGGRLMAALRAGLLGVGMMGRHHARVLRDVDGVELVAIADPGGDPHGVAGELPILPDIDALIDASIDIAVVAVPTRFHEDAALKLATAGVHTLVEKPIAHSIEAGQRMVGAFANAGLVGAVGHIERFNPALQELRRRIENGDAGEVYQIATRRQGPFPSRIADVGVAKDLASHDVDLTAWVAQSPYATIWAQTTFKSGREHEDMIAMTGRLENGIIVNHLVNWLSPMKERVTIVTGEKGSFIADTATGDLTFFANGTIPVEWESMTVFRGVSEGDVTRYAFAKREPLRVEHEAFRDAVLGKPSDVVTMEQGLRTLAVVEAALDAARTANSFAF